MYITGAVFQSTDWPTISQRVNSALTVALSGSDPEALQSLGTRQEAALRDAAATGVFSETALAALIEVASRLRQVGIHAEVALREEYAGAEYFLASMADFRWQIIVALSHALDRRKGQSVRAPSHATTVSRLVGDLRRQIDRRGHNLALARAHPSAPLPLAPNARAKLSAEFAEVLMRWRSAFGYPLTLPKDAKAKMHFKAHALARWKAIAVANYPAAVGLIATLGSKRTGPSVWSLLELLSRFDPGQDGESKKLVAVASAFASYAADNDWERQLEDLDLPVMSDNQLRKLIAMHTATRVFARFLNLPDELWNDTVTQWALRSFGRLDVETEEFAPDSLQPIAGSPISQLSPRAALSLAAQKSALNFLDIPFDALVRWSYLASEYVPILEQEQRRDGVDMATAIFRWTEWNLAESAKAVDGGEIVELVDNPGQIAPATKLQRGQTKRLKSPQPDSRRYRVWDDAGKAYGPLHHPATRWRHDCRATLKSLDAKTAFSAYKEKLHETFALLCEQEMGDPAQSGERHLGTGGQRVDLTNDGSLESALQAVMQPADAMPDESDEAGTHNAPEDRLLGLPEDAPEPEIDEVASSLDGEGADDGEEEPNAAGLAPNSLSLEADPLAGDDYRDEVERPSDEAKSGPGEWSAVDPDLIAVDFATPFPSYIREVAESFRRFSSGTQAALQGYDMEVRLNAIAQLLTETQAIETLPPSWVGRNLMLPRSAGGGRVRFAGLPDERCLWLGWRDQSPGDSETSLSEFKRLTDKVVAALNRAAEKANGA